MTAHLCTAFDPTCYRCELSRDEVDECQLVTAPAEPLTPQPTRAKQPYRPSVNRRLDHE